MCSKVGDHHPQAHTPLKVEDGRRSIFGWSPKNSRGIAVLSAGLTLLLLSNLKHTHTPPELGWKPDEQTYFRHSAKVRCLCASWAWCFIFARYCDGFCVSKFQSFEMCHTCFVPSPSTSKQTTTADPRYIAYVSDFWLLGRGYSIRHSPSCPQHLTLQWRTAHEIHAG